MAGVLRINIVIHMKKLRAIWTYRDGDFFHVDFFLLCSKPDQKFQSNSRIQSERSKI